MSVTQTATRIAKTAGNGATVAFDFATAWMIRKFSCIRSLTPSIPSKGEVTFPCSSL